MKSDVDVFDESTVLLMDFRTRSIKRDAFHLRVLPYSKREACKFESESILFSENVCSENFYKQAIDDYLKTCFKLEDYEITHEEKGVIPLGNLLPHDPK